MGGNQSKEEEQHQKKLEEYVQRQSSNLNQFYNHNQQIQTNNFVEDQFYNLGGPVMAQPQNIPKVQLAKTVAIKNEIFLIKSSLKMIKLNNRGYSLTFKYTCEVPAMVSIYQCATEIVDENNITKEYILTDHIFQKAFRIEHLFNLGVGKDLDFQVGQFELDLGKIDYSDLQRFTSVGSVYYPLIIRLERNQQAASRQYFYCSLLFDKSRQHLNVQCLKTKIEQNGQAYQANDVFGINDSCLNNSSDKECAVCLTEKINTMILPCRHMILCNECCEDMRRRSQKCPLCRGVIESFMQLENVGVNPTQNNDQQLAPQPQQNVISTQQPPSQSAQQQQQQAKKSVFFGQGVQIGGS